jgi:transposase, IS5 family
VGLLHNSSDVIHLSCHFVEGGMAINRTGQLGFVDGLAGISAGSTSLDRLSDLVKWYRFEKLLAPLRDGGPGRAAWPPLVLLKALILQSLYGLSDRELEEALSDRLSFRRFCGLSLQEGVPDHTVLCRFRNELSAGGQVDRLFVELDRQLEKAGVIVKRGTMLDATLIASASARPGKGREAKDQDARFARRQGRSGEVYGYKAHVGVDEGSGLIRTVITTSANINDTTPADALIRGDEKAVWADAAYHTHAREAALKARGVKARLARRPNKHHRQLPARLKRYNQLIARRRAAVETTFATWKNRMGLRAIRYVGLLKATAQVTMAAIAFNMRRWAALAP